ncbi:CD4-1 molecule [Melanotaenia boesemani]|uniref:CD4-1 molecule n=1 Tax=Melanotaenia boesemani TaxID=1250792 RepID=UPI001C03E1DD|nr:CD4-1 molecule [Melanotaenia boesemani]
MQGSIQSILFFIAVLKTVIGTEEVIYAQVGHDVTLKAPVDTSPKDYIYWYFYKEKELQLSWMNHMGGRGIIKDEPWNQQLSLNGDSLVIKGIHERNFGTYFYKLGKDSTVITYKLRKLTVNVNPASILLPGDKMSLQCNVDHQGEKQPNIYWQPPQEKTKTVLEAGGIIVQSQDSGEWTCVVKNGQKEHRFKISVIVVEFPSAPKIQYTSTTSQLNMPFSIHPINSWEKIKPLIKEIQWSFTPKTSSDQKPQTLCSFSPENSTEPTMNQKALKHASLLGNFSLSRDKGREDDQGVYECTIIFKKGKNLTSTVQVEVLQIIPSPGLTLISGQRLKLHCTIGGQLPPDVELKWSPKKTSTYTTENNSALLVIKEVRMEDGGMWKCELRRNNSCLTSAVIKLNIEPVLSVWMLVTICSAAAIIILLAVLTAILCRRKQRKRRHLRHQLCRCENPKPKGFYRT